MQYPAQNDIRHELLPIIAFDLYESQKYEYYEKYGEHAVESVYEELVSGEYSSIIAILKKLY
ncbi:MAG: hypothetical protein ACRCX8_10250 [Sarcina sp.]